MHVICNINKEKILSKIIIFMQIKIYLKIHLNYMLKNRYN